MQDEKKIWENFERDVLEVLPLFLKYETSFEVIEVGRVAIYTLPML